IDALRLLDTRGAPVDLVVTDMDMPGMDGVDLMRNLGRHALAGGVLVTSARESRLRDALEAVALHGARVRLVGSMLKPVRLEELVATLARAGAAGQTDGAVQATGDDFGRALERGEFIPYFQPRVEIATGALRGMEALLYWNHGALGLLGGTRFASALEGS